MPAAAKPAPPAEPIPEKKSDAPVKNPNPDMPAVEATAQQPLADAPVNDVVKPAEENPVADASAPEKPSHAPAADAPAEPAAPEAAAEKPAEHPAESKSDAGEPSEAPPAEEPTKTEVEKPADAPAAAVDAPAVETTEAPKKHAQPPPGGVRFGNVEIVAPSEPPAAPAEETKSDDDDEADEDYKVEKDEDTAADGEEEDGDEIDGVEIPENIPELPKGLLAQLLSSGSLGKKVLHEAAALGNVDEVRKLLADDGEMKGLINDLDMFAYTPLHIAAENGHVEVCKALIELKADVNASTKMYSSTALHYAAFEGHEDVLTVLLENGAEVNALTDDKRTPLFQAAFKGHLSCVEKLIKYGADPNVRNEEDKTPADVSTADAIKEYLADIPAAKKRKVSPVENVAN